MAAKERRGRLKLVRKRMGGTSKLGRFFLAGAKPTLAYGTSVSGVTPTELLTIRRTLAAAKGPHAQGTSLTHKLALNGDDAWNIAVAPALAWAADVWRSPGKGCIAPHFSASDLFIAWHAVGVNRRPDGSKSADPLLLATSAWATSGGACLSPSPAPIAEATALC
jgi:hypothetical protein